MILGLALWLLCLVGRGLPGRPMPGPLETACRVVQAEVADHHSAYCAHDGAATWLVGHVTWLAGDRVGEGPALLRWDGTAVAMLALPADVDSMFAWEPEQLSHLAEGGYAGHRVRCVQIADDAQRRAWVVALREVLPEGMRCQ